MQRHMSTAQPVIFSNYVSMSKYFTKNCEMLRERQLKPLTLHLLLLRPSRQKPDITRLGGLKRLKLICSHLLFFHKYQIALVYYSDSLIKAERKANISKTLTQTRFYKRPNNTDCQSAKSTESTAKFQSKIM